MQVGIDAGNALVKVAGPQGVISFDASLGEWRQRNLTSSHGVDDMEVEYAGKKFFAGSLARVESEFGGALMGNTKAHGDGKLRALLALVRYNGDTEYEIVVGQPIAKHTADEKQRIKNMLAGCHEILVNGIKHRFTISRIEVAPEGAAAIWSDSRMGEFRILDIGSGTVNCATVFRSSNLGRFVDRDSFTLPFGLNTTKSTDRAAMADGIARECLKKWKRNDDVLLVGGGAEDVCNHLRVHFPRAEVLRPSLYGGQEHPIFANAIGYYVIAKGVFK